jgi:hypothetical protein
MITLEDKIAQTVTLLKQIDRNKYAETYLEARTSNTIGWDRHHWTEFFQQWLTPENGRDVYFAIPELVNDRQLVYEFGNALFRAFRASGSVQRLRIPVTIMNSSYGHLTSKKARDLNNIYEESGSRTGSLRKKINRIFFSADTAESKLHDQVRPADDLRVSENVQLYVEAFSDKHKVTAWGPEQYHLLPPPVSKLATKFPVIDYDNPQRVQAALDVTIKAYLKNEQNFASIRDQATSGFNVLEWKSYINQWFERLNEDFPIPQLIPDYEFNQLFGSQPARLLPGNNDHAAAVLKQVLPNYHVLTIEKARTLVPLLEQENRVTRCKATNIFFNVPEGDKNQETYQRALLEKSTLVI